MMEAPPKKAPTTPEMANKMRDTTTTTAICMCVCVCVCGFQHHDDEEEDEEEKVERRSKDSQCLSKLNIIMR